jgi:hypothetical protein
MEALTMSNTINSNYLRIDIPEESKDKVMGIKIDSDLNIIIGLQDNNRTIISSLELKKGIKRYVVDWQKTKSILVSNLKGVESTVAEKISLLITQNYESINSFIKSTLGEESEKKVKLESRQKVFKYYSETEQKLYESIMLAGKPCFLSFDNGEFCISDQIEEITRTLIPFGLDDSPAKPYKFSSLEEVKSIYHKNGKTNTGIWYEKVKRVVKKYVDQNEPIINIITIDILFSYFQDRFPTTHYLFFIGNNGVGKSVIGEVMEILAYRGVKMTDPSPPNIFRLLGKVQPGQCTLIMDEVEKIDNNVEIMNILKTGYSQGGKVPKVNTNTYNQEFFNTYSPKVFLSERLPHNYTARGVLDRTFPITCVMGTPREDIKEVLMTQGIRGNQYLKELNEEIMNLRNEMFIFRLTHAYERRLDVDIGLKNRDRELCEGATLFFDTSVQTEVENTYQHFLNMKYEQKLTSFDYFLLSRIVELLEKSDDGYSISVSMLWESIKESINHKQNYDGSLSLDDYGFVLHYNQVSAKCKVYGAEIKHTNKGNKLVFGASSKIRHAHEEYRKRPQIKCSLVRHSEGSEGSEDSEGSIEPTPQICEINLKDTSEPLPTNT